MKNWKENFDNVLIHRPTPLFNEIMCSSKSLAEQWNKRGLKVYYMHTFTSPANILLKTRYFYDVWKKRRMKTYNGIIPITLFSWIPIKLIKNSHLLYLFYTFYKYKLRKIVNCAGNDYSRTLIWTTIPGSSRGLKRIFRGAKLAFHHIDYYPGFEGNWIREIVRQDLDIADINFFIGHSLYELYEIDYRKLQRSNVYVIGQAVDLASFEEKQSGFIRDKKKIMSLVYVGALAKLDVRLIISIAKELSEEVRITLIGPSDKNVRDNLAGLENVMLTGPMGREELGKYLNRMDIGLMLYKQNLQARVKGQHSLKLYEYAAAGLPIISSHQDELKHLDSPVKVISDLNGFKCALTEIVENYDEYSKKSRQFAELHTYDKLLDNVANLLFKQ